MKAGAWKAAHVLAGSLIHSALVAHLTASGEAGEEESLRMPFSGLLDLCRARQVLSPRTLDLAVFIRPYADLLSANGGVRLSAVTDETSARIAQALLEIVINEIASHQREMFRHNADRIVAKLQSDPCSSAIIPHLIGRISRVELERLLLDLIPKAYFETAKLAAPEAGERLRLLEQCYRAAFDASPLDLKAAVSRRFVQVVENESEYVVQCYEGSFFRGSDLSFLDPEGRALILAHFLAGLEKTVTLALVRSSAGIGEFLVTEEDVRAFFVPLVLRLLSTGDEELSAAIVERVSGERALVPEQLRPVVGGLMHRLLHSRFAESRSRTAASRLESALAGLKP
ncbi:MAG TPA: hypothetical protein VLH09_08250 [Bryobacteraceae bacterium]|nr:hypothetical protein [Bryobacteraceae bacterium]